MTIHRRSPLALAAILAAATPAGFAAESASADVEDRIEALRRLVESQQAQLEAQQRQLSEQQREIERLKAAAPQGASPPAGADLETRERPKLAMNANRLAVTSADGRSSIAVRANVQLDMAHYDQAPAGPPETDFRRGSVGAGSRENDAARDLSDGAYFRRARLGVEGTIARDFNYRFLAEFGGAGSEGPARINDAYIAYMGLAPFTFQVGAFSPPANMADGISTEDLLFIERASSAELSRALGGADGRLGIGMRTGGARWMGALTYTGRVAGEAETFDSQRALVGRLGGLVMASPDVNLHLGVNGTWVIEPAQVSQAAGAVQYAIRLRDRPELRVDSTRLIDTGVIDADSAYSAGVEFAFNWKNLLLQGEHFWYGIERRNSSLADPRFGGGYVEASWFLTGEHRRYVASSAAFQAPKPRIPFDGSGGPGALELALRYSVTDLDFASGLAGAEAAPEGVRGGEQETFGAGLNWYLNPNLKLMFNWLHVDVDRLNPASAANPAPFGLPPATPPIGVEIGQDLDIFALRTQFSF